jgi:hypothetical protein
MKLLTQNSDLKKTGIFGWTIPAHMVTLTDGTRFNTCPNAGVCGAFCYAKSGTYNFSNVKKAHIEKLELILNNAEKFVSMMNNELSNKKYNNKFVRIHDAGDFFAEWYAQLWIDIAKINPNVTFYTYTKEVQLFKSLQNIPNNFIVIYSFGGKQDYLIDIDNDRHSDVFTNYEEMIAQGYIDIAYDDKQAAINVNHKIGLYRNNIAHFVKKQGSKTFRQWQNKQKSN